MILVLHSLPAASDKRLPVLSRLSKNHDVVLVAAEGVDTAPLEEEAVKSFSGVVVLRYAPHADEATPQAQNKIFRAVVSGVARLGWRKPWFYCPYMATPLKDGWLDDIETAYRMSGKLFLATEIVCPGGNYAHGSMVYPHDFALRSVLWKYADDILWDLYCRWETGRSVLFSPLISFSAGDGAVVALRTYEAAEESPSLPKKAEAPLERVSSLGRKREQPNPAVIVLED